MGHSPLSAAATDKVQVEAYSNLLPRALEACCIISTTFHTVTIGWAGVPSKIPSNHAVLARSSMQPRGDIVYEEQQTRHWTPMIATPEI